MSLSHSSPSSYGRDVRVHYSRVRFKITLTVFAEAAQLGVLLPEDVLQPLGSVEVGEAVQATEQDFEQRAERESKSPCRPIGCWC